MSNILQDIFKDYYEEMIYTDILTFAEKKHKIPVKPINTRLGGFVILSDFHGVSALELGV